MEKTAFLAAAEQHQDTVYRMALHMLGSVPDAEDAVQEVFLRLYRQQNMDGEHLRRWLLRVTANYCRDVLRSPWRRRRVSLTELKETAAPAFERPEHGALYHAVMALPEKYRSVLYLFYYEELSAAETARVLGISVSAVTTRLARARAGLKAQLTEVWEDEE